MPITVAALHVYPVKGLKGIDLAEAAVTARGLAHDRRWMVVDPTGMFLTQRSHPRMATVWTDLVGDAVALSAPEMDEVRVPLAPLEGEPMRVTVWRNADLPAIAPSPQADAWLTEFLGMSCRLVYMPDSTHRPCNETYAGPGREVGFADGYSHLVIGEASLADLNHRLAARGHMPLPMNRFRPNIVIAGSEPYGEDKLGTVRIGAATLRAVKPCGRCQVTTTDQSTGEVRGPEPLETLSGYRESPEFGIMFGMNYVTESEGVLRVGDEVRASA